MTEPVVLGLLVGDEVFEPGMNKPLLLLVDERFDIFCIDVDLFLFFKGDEVGVLLIKGFPKFSTILRCAYVIGVNYEYDNGGLIYICT